MTDDQQQSPESRWKLTCHYTGRAARRTVTEMELRDLWTLLEMGEDVDKCEGRLFEDEDDAKGLDECPLTWKDGKATETGCGPWWGGVGRNTVAPTDTAVADCDALLVRAGLVPLTVLTADGVPDLEATFDMSGVNADALDILDRAEWRIVVVDDV